MGAVGGIAVRLPGLVYISRHGKTVTTVRGRPAATFLTRIAGLDAHAAQLVMTKATGHFKHGTERHGN